VAGPADDHHARVGGEGIGNGLQVVAIPQIVDLRTDCLDAAATINGGYVLSVELLKIEFIPGLRKVPVLELDWGELSSLKPESRLERTFELQESANKLCGNASAGRYLHAKCVPQYVESRIAICQERSGNFPKRWFDASEGDTAFVRFYGSVRDFSAVKPPSSASLWLLPTALPQVLQHLRVLAALVARERLQQYQIDPQISQTVRD
jgi:hypothetical protein